MYYDTSNPEGGGSVLALTPAVKQAHMSAIMNGYPMVGLANFAALRAFPVADCFEGRQACLSYHTNSTDIGGGIFVWVATSTADDNNGTIVCPTDYVGTGRWIRIESIWHPNLMSLAWFGARPSAVGFDNGALFNAAVQALPLYASTSQVINGGYMRFGSVYVPGGIWYVTTPCVASGGVRVFGDGPAKSILTVNNNTFSSSTAKTVSAVTWTSGSFRLTVTAHGLPVGYQGSGWIGGVSGTVANTLNSWHRFKVVDANTLRVLNLGGGSGSYTVSTAFIDIDNWVLDFQTDYDTISGNNTFGTVIENIQINGNRINNNGGTSGLNIAGAQQSYLYNVTVSDVGKIGTVCDVPADKLWVADSIKGPGYICTTSPGLENKLLHIEHHNQAGTSTMITRSGQTIPRPAVYLRDAHAWSCRQLQGEDSTLEMAIDSSTKIAVDLFNSNGPGVTDRNGFETTLLHISGDSYDFTFNQTCFSGVFKNIVNDQSLLAIAQSDAGIKQNLGACQRRAAGTTYATHNTLVGPCANDAAAAARAVPVGAMYWHTDGTAHIRVS